MSDVIEEARKLFREAKEFELHVQLHRLQFCGELNAYDGEYFINDSIGPMLEYLKLFNEHMEQYLLRMGRGS